MMDYNMNEYCQRMFINLKNRYYIPFVRSKTDETLNFGVEERSRFGGVCTEGRLGF